SGGIMTRSTRALTTPPNAPPMMIPTAISTMLPLSANSRNSLTIPLVRLLIVRSASWTGGGVVISIAGVRELNRRFFVATLARGAGGTPRLWRAGRPHSPRSRNAEGERVGTIENDGLLGGDEGMAGDGWDDAVGRLAVGGAEEAAD